LSQEKSEFEVSSEQFWNRQEDRKHSSEDVRAITENLTGFFGVLIEWGKVCESKLCKKNKIMK